MVISADSGTLAPLFERTYTLLEILGVDAVLGVGLQDHEPHPAELRELAGDLRAEERLHRLEHVAHRHAEHLGLVAVEVDEQLLARGAERGAHALQLGPLARLGDERLDRRVGGARIAGAAVLDVELEAAGGAQAGNRRRVERERDAVLAAEELGVQPLQRVERRAASGSLRSSNGFSRPNMIAALLFCWPSMKL